MRRNEHKSVVLSGAIESCTDLTYLQPFSNAGLFLRGLGWCSGAFRHNCHSGIGGYYLDLVTPTTNVLRAERSSDTDDAPGQSPMKSSHTV